MSTSRRPPITAVSDDEVRAVLDRYGCAVPLHAVRTRFLGDIASPIMAASPLDTVKALWGGELPEFDGLDAINELLRVLVMLHRTGITGSARVAWISRARLTGVGGPFRVALVSIAGLTRITWVSIARRTGVGGVSRIAWIPIARLRIARISVSCVPVSWVAVVGARW